MKEHCPCSTGTQISVNLKLEGAERRLVEDLISSMDKLSAIITDVAVGARFLGISAQDGPKVCTGLASTLGFSPTEGEHQRVRAMVGQPLGRAAELLHEDSGFSICLGTAVLNAGIDPPENQPDIQASIIMAEKTAGGEAVLVGEFPFTEWLRERVGTLHLFELNDVPNRTPPEKWDEILGRCRVLGLTGTSLITRSMASFLRKAPQAFVVIIGPSTPLSPVLFSYGADVLAGCRVESVQPVFAGIRKGLSFRQLKALGIRFIAWARDAQ